MYSSNSARAGSQCHPVPGLSSKGFRAPAFCISCGFSCVSFQVTAPFPLEAVRSLGAMKETMQQKGYRLDSVTRLGPQESCSCRGWPPGGSSRLCLL